MKKTLLNLSGYVFMALLGLFAVALCGRAFKGDPFAITLLVWELIDVACPFVIDEKKMPRWVERFWVLSIKLWFICALLWSVCQLNLI